MSPDRRRVDLSFAPACGRCGLSLEKVVEIDDFPGHRTVELLCACGQVACYRGKGLLGDRRR